MTEWLSLKEVCAKTEVSLPIVRKWINERSLKAYQFHPHGNVRVKAEDLEEFINNAVYIPTDER